MYIPLWILCASAVAAATELQTRSNVTIAPLAIPPDENWDGIDGAWSTFTLRVGTASQYVRTFLSFQSYQTWVIVPQGCPAQDYNSCADSRGGIFNYNQSTTWDFIGKFDLYIEQNLGMYGNALYGYDAVGLAGQGENGPTLKNTTVAGVATDEFYIGVFGVNPKPTNFTSFNDPSPSYMSQLKDQKLIPSVSVGYTGGAKYRFSGVYASLTLGGYDSSKFSPNNITFNFGQDNDHELLVGLQSITVPNKATNVNTPVQLLPNPIYIEIDPTVAQIWLPLEACQAFEAEFGLTYDNKTGLYLISSSQRDSLLSRNANVTFTMATTPTGQQDTVAISLPYAAFDQIVKPPYESISNQSYYFPLRRAANDSQYILGRTFLQEAYVVIAYEVGRFRMGPVVWDSSAQTSLRAIQPGNVSDPSSWTSSSFDSSSSSTPSVSSSSYNNTGAIVGGAVGGVLGLVVIAVIAYICIRRKRRVKATEISSSADSFADEKKGDRSSTTVIPKAELAGSEPTPFGLTHHDMDRKGLPMYPPSSAGTTAYSTGDGWSAHAMHGPQAVLPAIEAHSRAIYEMPGDMPNREKDGRQLSEKEALQHRERVYNGIDEAVESNPSSAIDKPRERRTVAPEEVVNANTGDAMGRHRAFSFEFGSSGTQSNTHDSDRTLANSEPSPHEGSSIGLADGGAPSPATPRHGNFI